MSDSTKHSVILAKQRSPPSVQRLPLNIDNECWENRRTQQEQGVVVSMHSPTKPFVHVLCMECIMHKQYKSYS